MARPIAFESLFRQAPVGLASLNSECVLLDFNDAFARLLGLSRQALAGRPLQEIEAIGSGLDAAGRQAMLDRVRAGGAPLVWRLGEGVDDWRRLTIRPLEDGGPDGAVQIASLEDAGECERERADLRRAAQRLEAVVQGAWDGFWELDFATGDIFVSDRWFELLGHEPAAFRLHGTGWIEMVHPDDRDRAQAVVDAHLRDDAPLEGEYRVRTRQGGWRWFRLRGRVVRGPDGRPLHVAGVMSDVHEKRCRDEQDALVARLTAALSRMTCPREMARRGLAALGEFLDASRCCLSVIDAEQPALRLVESWHAPTLRPGDLDAFVDDASTGLSDPLGRGESIRVDDVASHAGLRHRAEELAALDARALVVAPVVADGRLRAWLAVADDGIRGWTDDETRFVQYVARRLWPAVQRALDERARHLLRERLELALEAGEMGVWTWEPGARRLDLSPEMRVLLGLRDEDPTIDTVLARVHPDDLPHLRDAAWAGVKENRPLSVQYRVRLPGGRVRWLASHGRVRLDAVGRVTGMMGVAMDISTLRALEEALREADRRKDEFLATLAHELRNPLAAISNAVQALDGDQVDPLPATDRAMLVTLVGRQVQHLARLVDDLLDVARITQGKIELRPQPVDPMPLLRQAVEQVQPLVQARHQRLVLHDAPRRLMVRADPARFTQVMANLLNNAAKYGVPGGRVDVEMALEDGDMLAIRVRDDGIGIDPALLPRIFDLFTQADPSLDRTQGGLGIGLTLTRRLVEMHGGRIEAASEGLGRGSVFTVRWPALVERRARGRDPAVSPVEADPGADIVHRVLLVDDNIDSAESLAMLLQREGFDVRVAHDGGSGLRLAADLDPDVVVLDIGLPDMDGYEVARRLRMQHPAPRPRLVALTGYGSPRDRERSSRAGFDAHLVKPAEVRALLTQIRKAAGRGGTGDPDGPVRAA